MPKIELWSNEAHAIDMACMNLMETVRRGRKKQEAYVQEGDPEGAAFLEDGIAGLVQARRQLQNLLERAGWTREMISHAYKESANAND
jgi:DNA-binding phage protein